MTTPMFTPSSNDLLNMIAQAERKCDHSIEQARLQLEAQEEARRVRAATAQTKARFYARIQHGW